MNLSTNNQLSNQSGPNGRLFSYRGWWWRPSLTVCPGGLR